MYKQGRLKHKGRDYANSVSALVPIFVSLIRVLEVIMELGKNIRLSSRSRELLACQKFMTILMGHKAALQHMQLRKSAVDFSQLLTVEVEGCLNVSDLFLYILDLGFSQEFIASDQKQGNKILITSSATMGLNF